MDFELLSYFLQAFYNLTSVYVDLTVNKSNQSNKPNCKMISMVDKAPPNEAVVSKMTDKTGLLRRIPLILPNLILQENYFFTFYKMKMLFSFVFFY